jgi:hypothetical protein
MACHRRLGGQGQLAVVGENLFQTLFPDLGQDVLQPQGQGDRRGVGVWFFCWDLSCLAKSK